MNLSAWAEFRRRCCCQNAMAAPCTTSVCPSFRSRARKSRLLRQSYFSLYMTAFEVQQNTLYVMTQGAYLHRDHLALQVTIDGEIRLAVPPHNFQAVSLFGNVMVSPGAMQLCAEA